ncbi:MAG TPA: universal stress protein [Deltaproteobacteria bacterium]|jgi:nucleotide-binding universal stress UspA family protein|nr:universal stress protein [Deltaproteobacteria bacterium]
MSHILAAVDFSGVSERVLENAELLARAQGGRLTLLHVAAPNPAFVGYESGPQSVRDGRARSMREEHSALQRQAARLRERGLDAHALVVEGPNVETILREAQRLGSTMIVMGSHGHGALYDALVGSVSAGVIRGASCPVLIVPAGRGA